MFEAKPDPNLIPFDGTFRVADRTTVPDRQTLDSRDWKQSLEDEKKEMGRLQHKLFADQRYSLLLIFQALDAAGKDSTIRHALTGINPTGIRVTSFKAPTDAELVHDFLWRTALHLPPRGHIGVFNRSYYEEVLVVRVHPQFLAAQGIADANSPEIWARRYRSIIEHEAHLARSGTVILKFWLNVSKEEQRRRLLARIERPNKRWKFNPDDIKEREYWDSYQAAFEDCLKATSRPSAPWYAIPADDKAYARYEVARVINQSIKQLDVEFPTLGPEHSARLAAAKGLLGG